MTYSKISTVLLKNHYAMACQSGHGLHHQPRWIPIVDHLSECGKLWKHACTSYKQCSNTLYISIYHCIVHPEPKWHHIREAIQGWDPRHITSAVHPDRPCEQCALCKQRHLSKYSHPKAWKNPSLLQQFQTAEPSLNIQPDSCICLLCRKDVSSITDDSFSPRWRRNIDTVRQCYIPDCQNTDIKGTKQASLQDLVMFFREGNDDTTHNCMDDNPVKDVPLCNHHYMQWYRHTHTTHSKCKTCGKNQWKRWLGSQACVHPVAPPVVSSQLCVAHI